MNTAEQNKQFMKGYFREIAQAKVEGHENLLITMHNFIKDQKLIDHILFFQKSFPDYYLIIKELKAAGEKVFVTADFVGKHDGATDSIPATYKNIQVPFALCYTIKEEKIVDFWAIANEIEFFEQLGLSKDEIDVPQS